MLNLLLVNRIERKRTIATTVYNSEEVEFLDGSSATLKPLSIKRLRKFHAKFDAWTKLAVDFEGDERDYENASTDMLMEMAAYCLDQRPELLEKDEDGDLNAASVLDMESIVRIIYVCAGIDLKKMSQVALEMASQGQGGTN